MILAAGLGTRLGPLTHHLPKPLLPVANRPVMAYGLQCLAALGITEVCANASYLAEQLLSTFGDGDAQGVHLHWLVEDEPSGTAGGMKRVQRYLGDDRIVLIAGDAMLDVDLAPLLRAHEAHGSFATLATIPVSHPSHYGVVVTDDKSHIIQFQEKPAPGTEISRQANTGIYIFEPEIFDLIPAGEFCDFALHIFPEILRLGLPFHAFPVDGYWTDVGNPGEYLRANMDFLQGGIHVEGTGTRLGGNLICGDAACPGAQLSNCVIGTGVTLPAGSALSRCVVWPQTAIPDPLVLEDGVVTPWGTFEIREGTAHPQESVVA
jgi:mannose-1-phosphate guanylyltransferase/mannose-1-phosphate guanylyltransferase/phosphomannomutase